MTHEYVHFVQGDERGMQSGKRVRPLHIIAASALRAGQMPPIRGILTMQYGQDPGWSNPLAEELPQARIARMAEWADELESSTYEP